MLDFLHKKIKTIDYSSYIVNKNKLCKKCNKIIHTNELYCKRCSSLINKQIKIDNIINKLLNSSINFDKYGWVNKAAKIIEIKHMPEFYETKCFKRKFNL